MSASAKLLSTAERGERGGGAAAPAGARASAGSASRAQPERGEILHRRHASNMSVSQSGCFCNPIRGFGAGEVFPCAT